MIGLANLLGMWGEVGACTGVIRALCLLLATSELHNFLGLSRLLTIWGH